MKNALAMGANADLPVWLVGLDIDGTGYRSEHFSQLHHGPTLAHSANNFRIFPMISPMLLLDPAADAIAEKRAVGNDDGGAGVSERE
jgi:hypothetical protein